MSSHRQCKRCGQHPAVFSYHRGHVHRDRKHDLCPRCYRSRRSAFLAETMKLTEGTL
jgi:hypothetical protein